MDNLFICLFAYLLNWQLLEIVDTDVKNEKSRSDIDVIHCSPFYIPNLLS